MTSAAGAGETQACADAAAERIQDLEQLADSQAKDREADAAQAAAALAAAQADSTAQLQAAAASHQAAISAVQAELAAAQVEELPSYESHWLSELQCAMQSN